LNAGIIKVIISNVHSDDEVSVTHDIRGHPHIWHSYMRPHELSFL